MRLPKATELDSDQQAILDAPLTSNLFVSGPPGCGKTVIALYRAMAASKSNQPCQMIMYTNVLTKYTSGGGGKEIPTSTMNSWLSAWWKAGRMGAMPKLEPKPNSRWRDPDYPSMQVNIFQQQSINSAMNWGHLVIDEGQDFPPEFYNLLNTATHLLTKQGEEPPVMTILADENQRITEENSSLEDIRDALQYSNPSHRTLCKNYRNTKRISLFTNHFSVGLETGTGSPVSTRDGETPRIVTTSKLNDSIERIVRYANNHPDHQIGIFVNTQKLCKSLYNRLSPKLGSRVQASMSGWKTEDKFKPENLDFDSNDKITILCLASMKGLEFDAVFLPELHHLNPDAGSEDGFKMKMFVACSRAREFLELHYQHDDPKTQSAARWLPSRESGLAHWDSGAEPKPSATRKF